jgi:drug/metabolite transporter (DMT)-like permease
MRSGAIGAGKSTPGPGAWATHAALLVVQIAFASQAVEAKVAMMPRALGGEEIFPEALAMLRMMGGALFFQAIVRLRAPQEGQVSRSDHLKLVGLSVLGVAANQTLFLLGLRWTTPFAVSLLGATIPVFAATFAVLFGKERLVGRTVLGLILAVGGVLSLIGFGSVDRGAILVALNSASYAAYVVLSRDVVRRVGALRSMAWIFTYGGLLFLPLGFRPLVAQLPLVTPRGGALLAYILVMPTLVAYSFNAWALARSSATLVTAYIYLQPLLAGLLAWVQLGQGIRARAGVAAVLILVGLGIVASRQPARERLDA